MEEEHFIPGIYNYCDRWCERCPLTSRCRVFATEQAALAQNADIADPDKEAYWKYIADNFAEAMQMLHQAAAQMGLDLDELPDTDYDPAAERRRIDGMDFVLAARAYSQSARTWLEANRDPILRALGRDIDLGLEQAEERAKRVEDAFTVMSWYLFQIEVKLRRGQHSLEDPFGNGEPDESALEQANAAAKIALIGIERSLGAWNLLYQGLPEHQDRLIDLMAALERTRQLTVAHFPGAPGFRRPGFDD